ncbi:MAG: hypothetical protein K0U72_03525 [Gammaproteobacteria bacterium]|nr:hypothetical protein [Gammaproteobacteria bacterium]
MTHEMTMRWLKIGSGITMFFGVFVATAAFPPISGLMQFSADLIFFPVDGMQDVSAPETRLVSAIGGGVMFGWGLMMWMLASRLYPKDPALAGSIIVTSIIGWFVLDTGASILAGAPLNALGNLSFLLIFCVPIWMSRRA